LENKWRNCEKRRRRKKDGAKMELRKNGTINTPFLLSHGRLDNIKKGGISYFSFIKHKSKHIN
jgi:hypothetical protein